MNDLKFMFLDNKGDISNKIESEIIKKSKKEGINSDLINLTGGFPCIIPTNNNIDNKEKQRQKWVWSEFENPARIDGLRLNHWQRIEDVKKDYEYAQLNKKINIVNVRKEEYFQVCDKLDPTWDWEETEYLWDLCRTFDLKFIAIHDRYNYNNNNYNNDRSIEDLKERYYSVCRKILKLRKNYDHPILKSGYNYEQEIKRRACLDRIINKNNEQQALEVEIIDQANEIKNKIEKYQKYEKLEKKLIKHVEDQDLADGTFEDYIKNKPYTNTSFAYLRSYKLNHPPPINEKIQKKVDIMLKELGVPEKLIPTERVEYAYDTLKNNLIIMTSLKKHLEKKEFDKKKLELSLTDIQTKISNNNKYISNNINNSNLLNSGNDSKDISNQYNNNNTSLKKEKKKILNTLNNISKNNSEITNNNQIISKPKKKKIVNEEESKTESSLKIKKKHNNNNNNNNLNNTKNENNKKISNINSINNNNNDNNY